MLVAVSIVLFIEALRRTKEVRGGSNWAKDLFHFLIALLLLVGALCAATLAGILLNVLLQ